MAAQAQPNYLANKDCDVRTIQLNTAIEAGYAVGYDGNLPVAGGSIQGILRYGGEAGDHVPCTTSNTASAIVGAVVTNGQDLAVDGAGKLIPAVSGNLIVARALDDSGAADLYITVELKTESIKA